MLYSFDDYTLDAEHYELRQAGRLVRLAPRVFNLLAYLVQHPGRTRHERGAEGAAVARQRGGGRILAGQRRGAGPQSPGGHGPGAAIHPDRPSPGLPLRGAGDRRPPGAADLPAAPAPDTPRPPATPPLDQANAVVPLTPGPQRRRPLVRRHL